jgi:hypothetical protein
MYEELASDGSTRMVGTLEDIQNQYKLKQRSRDTSNSKVDDGFISDMCLLWTEQVIYLYLSTTITVH